MQSPPTHPPTHTHIYTNIWPGAPRPPRLQILATPAVDMYAFGVTLMQVLLICTASRTQPLPLPPRLGALVEACMAAQPLQRPGAAWVQAELGQVLGELVEGAGLQAELGEGLLGGQAQADMAGWEGLGQMMDWHVEQLEQRDEAYQQRLVAAKRHKAEVERLEEAYKQRLVAAKGAAP